MRIPRSSLARYARNCLGALERWGITSYSEAFGKADKPGIQGDVGEELEFCNDGGELPLTMIYRSFDLPLITASLSEAGEGEICVRCDEQPEGYEGAGGNNGNLLFARNFFLGIPGFKELLHGLEALS